MDCSSITDFQQSTAISIAKKFRNLHIEKTQKMRENGEISTAGKNFTLPPALTALTNSTSDWEHEESSNQRLWPLQADTEKCCLIGPVKQSIYRLLLIVTLV